MRTLPAILRSVAAAFLACLLTAPVALAADTGEHTKIDVSSDSSTSASSHVSSGGSIVRTIFALLIVLAVIYGITWALKQVKASKATAASGNSLEQIASLPLGGSRALHLVRAGDEVVLIGTAELPRRLDAPLRGDPRTGRGPASRNPARGRGQSRAPARAAREA